ncbi:MAG: hypothetical protein IKR98_06725 [Bacteroidaceae bacterium]|nr:hypothetical protein [Bacteroidaceae bacterium]
MTNEQIKKLCKDKEQELLDKYFGDLAKEASDLRPETVGEYTQDYPLKVEAEYKAFLEELWLQCAPEEMKGTPLVLEEEKLRELMTSKARDELDAAFKDATTRTLWERITQSNHEDVAYYKGLLMEYTREMLMLMRLDFLEEITGEYIENKAFENE